MLLKDFATCKIIAHRVNDALAEAILVDRKPGHGGIANPKAASFIDLAIYTKDRPFRLILSCKITSPDRPFVDGQRRAFAENRDDRTMVLDTLVVPPNASGSKIIEIKTNDSAAASQMGGDDNDGTDGTPGAQTNVDPGRGFMSRMFQGVSSLLSGASTEGGTDAPNAVDIPADEPAAQAATAQTPTPPP